MTDTNTNKSRFAGLDLDLDDNPSDANIATEGRGAVRDPEFNVRTDTGLVIVRNVHTDTEARVLILPDPDEDRRIILLHLAGDASVPENWLPVGQVDSVGIMPLASDPEVSELLDVLARPGHWRVRGVEVERVDVGKG